MSDHFYGDKTFNIKACKPLHVACIEFVDLIDSVRSCTSQHLNYQNMDFHLL